MSGFNKIVGGNLDMAGLSKIWSLDSVSHAWLAIILAITSPLWMTYLYSYIVLYLGRTLTGSKRPPWHPYWVPVLGHSLKFASRPFELWEDALAKHGRGSLFGILLLGLDAYQATTPEQAAKVFRAKGMIETEAHADALERAFGMPRESVAVFARDDSGYGVKPAEGSNIAPEDRIMLRLHNFVTKSLGLGGHGLKTLIREYQESLINQYIELSETMNEDEWLELPDLVEFFRNQIMKAALYAVFGPNLLKVNPNFIEDFWQFNPTMGMMFLGVPRWSARKAYERRDRLVGAIEKYHEYARDHYMGNGDEDWEECWGSRFSRERDDFFLSFKGISKKARASEDLSFVWAANANSVEAATWMMVEALRDPAIQPRLEQEFSSAVVPSEKTPRFDVDKLMSSPLAQSMYAEVLRTTVTANVSRLAKEDMDFDGFLIKKGERVAAATQLLSHNPEIWSKGPKPSMKDFWADRFLVYPNDPMSGPLKNPKIRKSTNAENEKSEEPRFSMEGLTHSWIPYSGGSRHCPGRHFAKQEMILTAAITMQAFEVELMTEEGWVPQVDTAYYGFGTMPIKGKVPCRIRRRKGWLKE